MSGTVSCQSGLIRGWNKASVETITVYYFLLSLHLLFLSLVTGVSHTSLCCSDSVEDEFRVFTVRIWKANASHQNSSPWMKNVVTLRFVSEDSHEWRSSCVFSKQSVMDMLATGSSDTGSQSAAASNHVSAQFSADRHQQVKACVVMSHLLPHQVYAKLCYWDRHYNWITVQTPRCLTEITDYTKSCGWLSGQPVTNNTHVGWWTQVPDLFSQPAVEFNVPSSPCSLLQPEAENLASAQGVNWNANRVSLTPIIGLQLLVWEQIELQYSQVLTDVTDWYVWGLQPPHKCKSRAPTLNSHFRAAGFWLALTLMKDIKKVQLSLETEQHTNDLFRYKPLFWNKDQTAADLITVCTFPARQFNNTRVLYLSQMPLFPMGAVPEEGSLSSSSESFEWCQSTTFHQVKA